MTDPIPLARHGDIECLLLPALANCHGLITGATGTARATRAAAPAPGPAPTESSGGGGGR